MRSSSETDVIHGYDPEDEIHHHSVPTKPSEKSLRDWNKVYRNTKEAASLVMENIHWGVTHD